MNVGTKTIITTTVIIPGCANGNIITQKDFIGEHPSIAAASSNKVDRVAKKLIKKNPAKGTVRQIYIIPNIM